MPEHKNTLAREAYFAGIGAHSGRHISVALKPSASGRIVFRRQDLGGMPISVDPFRAEARNCMVLTEGEASVRTVEHLLAALVMSGVDSLEVELDGEEVPIMDGSARPLVELILEAGKRPLDEARKVMSVVKPLLIEQGSSAIVIDPGPNFEVSYSIEYDHPLIRKQELSLFLNLETFESQVAPARTFGFLRDAEKLRKAGLARGSSLENTVVLDEHGVVNPPLRFADEFVRHKILDLTGDLALLGSPLHGRVRAENAGHSLHLRAVQSLLQGYAVPIDF